MSDAPPALLLMLMALAAVAVRPWAGPASRRRDRQGDARPRRHGGRSSGGRSLGRWRAGWPWRSAARDLREPPVDDAVVLDMVRAALRAGADVVSAIECVGAALPASQGGPCIRAARALRLGASWDAAWQSPGELARALAPAWSDGVDPEPLLAHAAAAIRTGRRARAREAAARLGVRLVLPLGLCLLPAFVLLGLVPVLLSAGLELGSP